VCRGAVFISSCFSRGNAGAVKGTTAEEDVFCRKQLLGRRKKCAVLSPLVERYHIIILCCDMPCRLSHFLLLKEEDYV